MSTQGEVSSRRGRSAHRRRPRKPRKEGERNNVKNNRGNQAQLPPNLKLTVRNIGNSQRHGTVAQVVSMIRMLVENYDKLHAGDCSSQKKILPRIMLDEVCIEKHISAEKSANDAKLALESNKGSAEEGEEGTENADEKNMLDTNEQEQKETKQEEATAPPPFVPEGKEESTMHSSTSSPPAQESPPTHTSKTGDISAISLRFLYCIPPRKSRRWGEKGGCAYLVLSLPLDPTMERSQAVAHAQLCLEATADNLSVLAKEDASTVKNFGGCEIAVSPSPKIWRDRTDRAVRRGGRAPAEGSIEKSDDFKKYIEGLTKSADERKARPKPAPGGATAAAETDATVPMENGQQLSALVLHLRAKREERKVKQKKSSANGSSGKKSKGTSKKQDPENKRKKKESKKRGRGEKKTGKKGDVKTSNGKQPASAVLKSTTNQNAISNPPVILTRQGAGVGGG